MATEHKLMYEPNFAVPPGETLAEILDSLEMTQAELARRMGRPLKTVNEIVQGRAAITPATSLQLEKVLGLPASFWDARERNFRQALARMEEDEALNTQLDWVRRFPIRQMMNWGWIRNSRDKLEQLHELLRFFGIASPDEWEGLWGEPQVAYRRSPAFRSEPAAVSAWLRQGERLGQEIECAPFDRRCFKATLMSARGLTRTTPDVFCTALRNSAAACGVAVVFVPELPKAPISGATRWLGQSKALIQLSLRYKTDDHLWFTFFHEAGHILKHGKTAVFIEGSHTPDDAKEREADHFAASFLIPQDRFSSFVAGKRVFSKHEIRRFAASIGVSPGIVVGRLQHEKSLPQTHCNGLKMRLQWSSASD